METGTMGEMEKLLILQDHDVRIREIERELKDIPERKREEDQRLAGHRAEVAAAEAEHKARQAAIKQFELEVQARREQILKLRRQQVDLKTNKEFAAIESEIKTIEQAIRAQEDSELELMGLVDEASRQLEARKLALVEEAKVVQKDVVVWDERATGLEGDLSEARAARAEAAKTITQSDWMAAYTRVFSRKDRAIVPLEDGVCGGCHMKLPPYVVHEANRRNSLVTCGYCGRMLYTP